MSEERTKQVVVAPAHISALYEGQKFNNFSVGKVSFEKEGVDDRRGLISPRLTPDGWDNLKAILKKNNHLDKVEFRDRIPHDWRHRELM